MSNKRKMALTIIGVLICVCAVLGVSYAYWVLVLQQKDSNIVSSDCFSIEFEEGETISLQNTFPIADEDLIDFLTNTTPYHFKIVNKCDSNVKGFINLETISVSGKKLSDEYVDVLLYDGRVSLDQSSYLTGITYYPLLKADVMRDTLWELSNMNSEIQSQLIHANINESKVLDEALTAYKLADIDLAPYEEKEYNLLLWLDKSATATEDVMNTNWSGKITVSTNYVTNDMAKEQFNYVLLGTYKGTFDMETCLKFSEGSSEAESYCERYNSMNETTGFTIDEFIPLYSLNLIKDYYVENATEAIVCSINSGGTYVDDKYNYLAGRDMNPVVPSSIDGIPVTSIGEANYYCRDLLENDHNVSNSFNGYVYYSSGNGSNVDPNKNVVLNSITLNEGIKSISGSSFAYNRLENVNFPSTLQTIEENAFLANLLTEVVFDPSTSLYIGKRAFNNNQIEKIVLNGDITFDSDLLDKNDHGFVDGGVFKNNPVTEIVNNTGKSYDWQLLLTGEEGEAFETGSLEIDGRKIEITKDET